MSIPNHLVIGRPLLSSHPPSFHHLSLSGPQPSIFRLHLTIQSYLRVIHSRIDDTSRSMIPLHSLPRYDTIPIYKLGLCTFCWFSFLPFYRLDTKTTFRVVIFIKTNGHPSSMPSNTTLLPTSFYGPCQTRTPHSRTTRTLFSNRSRTWTIYRFLLNTYYQ